MKNKCNECAIQNRAMDQKKAYEQRNDIEGSVKMQGLIDDFSQDCSKTQMDTRRHILTKLFGQKVCSLYAHHS